MQKDYYSQDYSNCVWNVKISVKSKYVIYPFAAQLQEIVAGWLKYVNGPDMSHRLPIPGLRHNFIFQLETNSSRRYTNWQ